MKLPLPPLTTLISILLAILLTVIFPIQRVISYPYNLLGILVIILGARLISSAVKIFDKEKTDIHPRGTPSFLIMKGPYKFTRNPIYSGMIMISFGVAVVLGSLSAFIAPVMVFLVVNLFVIPFEEKTLKKVFGKDYIVYQKKVRRWF